MRCKLTLLAAAIMLAALYLSWPVQAGEPYPFRTGVGSPYDPYSPSFDPFYPYDYFPNRNYYRGRDGHFYQAGPPPFAEPPAGPQPRFLPNFRPDKPPCKSAANR